jgi:hypothetical protein
MPHPIPHPAPPPTQPAHRPPTNPTHITDASHHLALLSTHLIRGEQCAEARLGRQSDRAAGWSCARQSRAGRWPTAAPSWLPSAAGAVHRNTVGWPSARPLGMVAQEVRMRPCLRQRVGVLGQRPVSSVWCGCPAARVPVHAAAVRCPVRASERPDVRRPVSSVGVRCPWVPASTVSGRGWGGVAPGQAAAWLGWPASAWSPALSTASWSAAESEPGGRGWPRSAGSGEGSAWTWPSFVGGGWAVAGSTAWATGMG